MLTKSSNKISLDINPKYLDLIKIVAKYCRKTEEEIIAMMIERSIDDLDMFDEIDYDFYDQDENHNPISHELWLCRQRGLI